MISTGKKRYDNNRVKKETGESQSPLIEAVSARIGHIVHLTHNDLDAAGCDAIHRMKYDDIVTIFSSVSKFKSNLEKIAGIPGNGDILSISDIGYQPEAEIAAKAAAENGWKIEWRDHHRWTDGEIELIKGIAEYLCVDNSVCATCIVRRDLAPDNEFAGKTAAVVCDYDLWKHEIPESKILGEVCTKRENLDCVRDCFVSGNILNDEIREIYKGIEAEKNEAIAKSIKHVKIYSGRYKIAFAPLYGYPSETAHAVRDKLGTDIEVIVSDNGKFSIRSVPPVSHLIAKVFGGGGHPPAAGGSFKFSLGDKFSFAILKKTKHYQKLFDAAEKIDPEN